MSAQFSIKAADPCAVAALQQALSLPRIVAATLVARGITEPAEACRFMHPSLDTDWLNPYDIPGMEEVVDALEAAVKRGDRILVFGDFDVDGITATTVLTRGLRAFGADARPFIPRRFDEGYALTDAALKRACECNPQFIVTVDCGISCKKEAAEIVAAGLGLAITDHHEPGDAVPEGVPLTDPKCSKDCKSAVLAGAGVALKAGAGAGRAPRPSAPVARVHRLRRHGHRGRPHAHATGRTARSWPTAWRGMNQQTAPVHRGAFGLQRQRGQGAFGHQSQLLAHPAPERRRDAWGMPRWRSTC